jgi:hypothetical protein
MSTAPVALHPLEQIINVQWITGGPFILTDGGSGEIGIPIHLWTSEDGFGWVATSQDYRSNDQSINQVGGIAWGSGIFLMAGGALGGFLGGPDKAFLVSSEDGLSWQTENPPSGVVNITTISYDQYRNIFICGGPGAGGTGGGNFKSEDKGKTWISITPADAVPSSPPPPPRPFDPPSHKTVAFGYSPTKQKLIGVAIGIPDFIRVWEDDPPVSTDLRTWKPVMPIIDVVPHFIMYNSKGWVAAGANTGNPGQPQSGPPAHVWYLYDRVNRIILPPTDGIITPDTQGNPFSVKPNDYPIEALFFPYNYPPVGFTLACAAAMSSRDGYEWATTLNITNDLIYGQVSKANCGGYPIRAPADPV